ncbi:glutaredoxin domain-containing cysteine-rich protein CG12206-like [Paramacrobiotus metropolitanus]|uniref:glutaredoxin domain-containing cysteine-rich protein CG12206-like n=1 Tax=Paramacrobiotus metropolitanus TaxID=2943436 RepID=UPI002445F49E|nr:glutaredoxin domain-containing cysteine-rich protein CG12206-like [Paramacrobiotus metropolitanus]
MPPASALPKHIAHSLYGANTNLSKKGLPFRPKVTHEALNAVLQQRKSLNDRQPDAVAEYDHYTGNNNPYESLSCGDSDEIASDSVSMTTEKSETSTDDLGSTVSCSSSSGFEYDHHLKFHCKEFQMEPDDHFIASSILTRSPCGTSPIVSRKGSTRGVRGRVRATIDNFNEAADAGLHCKNYQLIERGRAVLYVTSLAVCRSPFLRCLEIRKILHNLMVKYTECDLYINRDYQQELKERLGCEKSEGVPQLFVEGQYVGDFDVIQRLNESGQLRILLKPYKMMGVLPPCQRCGGFSVVPCTVCCGSKKSTHRNAFTDQFHALRCSSCDANGLQRCPLCTSAT